MRYVLAWLALWALYLGLAGSVSGSELLTGAIVAGACSGWAALLRHCSPHRFAASRAHLAPWSRSLRQLFPQAFATGAVLVRAIWRGGPLGTLRTQAFVPGAGALPETHARRASALLCASLAPARFIVRLEPTQAHALLHELYPSDERRPADGSKEHWLV
jgi:hypothetical protein